MIKKILTPIITSFMVIFAIGIIYNILSLNFPIKSRSVAFGITVHYSGIIFATLFLIYNAYLEFQTKSKYLIGLVFFLTTIILPVQAITDRPFRSLMLIALILIGYGLTIIIHNKRVTN